MNALAFLNRDKLEPADGRSDETCGVLVDDHHLYIDAGDRPGGGSAKRFTQLQYGIDFSSHDEECTPWR